VGHLAPRVRYHRIPPPAAPGLRSPPLTTIAIHTLLGNWFGTRRDSDPVRRVFVRPLFRLRVFIAYTVLLPLLRLSYPRHDVSRPFRRALVCRGSVWPATVMFRSAASVGRAASCDRRREHAFLILAQRRTEARWYALIRLARLLLASRRSCSRSSSTGGLGLPVSGRAARRDASTAQLGAHFFGRPSPSSRLPPGAVP